MVRMAKLNPLSRGFKGTLSEAYFQYVGYSVYETMQGDQQSA